MKDQIKTAFADAEKELQEKEIAHFKGIITYLLQEKTRNDNEERLFREKSAIIKQAIDDFKAGRIDKIKELQEKNPLASKLLPFSVEVTQQPQIMKPWIWNYTISTPQFTCDWNGNLYATFTSGTYIVNGKTINL